MKHPSVDTGVTLSGREGDDAKPYQEKEVQNALEELRETKAREGKPGEAG